MQRENKTRENLENKQQKKENVKINVTQTHSINATRPANATKNQTDHQLCTYRGSGNTSRIKIL